MIMIEEVFEVPKTIFEQLDLPSGQKLFDVFASVLMVCHQLI